MQQQRSKNSFVEINLSALEHNIQVLQSHLSDDVGQMAVIKSNAYGHGAVEVAKSIQKNIDWLAVNDVDEGMELREAGIDLPILVFGVPTRTTAPAYTDYDLTATISSLQHFDILRPGTEYHLNFDTGMGRLGLLPDEVPETKGAMETTTGITCTGIYSHFATADDPGSEKAEHQLSVFESLRKRFDSDLLTHMANTGGTVFYPSSHFDMVRTGIGIYGYAPGSTPLEDLTPAMGWQSHFAQIKKVSRGDSVSYGARWHAPENGYVGVVPVGYEEGVPRILTGNLEVAVEGSFLPVVGTVTMNYIMVYLGSYPKFEEGTPVQILGREALTAAEWARRTETIPYEIVCGISSRLPRVYKAK